MQENENQLRSVLGVELSPSAVIDAKMEETYRMIRNAGVRQTGKKNPVIHSILVGMGSVAAVFALMVTFCVMNPVLASELPIVGGLFEKLADVFSFGRLPEEDTTILFEARKDSPDEESQDGGAKEESAYRQTSGDITVTLTEEYATNQAVFIGVNVKNAKEFPRMVTAQDGTQYLYAITKEQYSFRNDTLQGSRIIEGRFEDAYTFDGIMRIGYSDINIDDSKYVQALEAAEQAGEELPITDENYEQYMEKISIPKTFTVKLEIVSIIGDLEERLPVEGEKSGAELERMTDEEWEAYMHSLPQDYSQFPNRYENWWQDGNWPYDLTIAQKDDNSRVIEINQTNADGIGIKSIELSSVEMTLNTIEKSDTIAVALDADGNKIENGGFDAYALAITGHDISKVYIYICDYDEYMDEIKGYGVPGNSLGRSFQEVLEERAVFKTVVETQ